MSQASTPVIKPTRRELLRTAIEHAASRLQAELSNLAERVKVENTRQREAIAHIRDLVRQTGIRLHRSRLKKLTDALEQNGLKLVVSPTVTVIDRADRGGVFIDLDQSLGISGYVQGTLDLQVNKTDELMGELRGWVAEASDASGCVLMLGKQQRDLNRRIQDLNTSEFIYDLVQRLPEEAGPLLDQLAELIVRAQEAQNEEGHPA